MEPMAPASLPPLFEANSFPLQPGLQLLEASAGTGKTFALAHLVLRLVAEEGLSLRQVLVVTYTEAAAAELRSRIGERLDRALSHLEAASSAAAGPHELPAPDPVLADWLAVHGPMDQGSGHLRARLLLAQEDLDGADITTIHGFCHRSLQRLALEAASAPEQQLDSEGDALIQQVVHAYWQQQVLALPPGWVAGLQQQRLSPALLMQVLRQLDGDPALQLDPLPAGGRAEQPLAELLLTDWPQRWQTFCHEWKQRGRELEAAFCTAAACWRQAGARSTTPYAAKPRRDRCNELDQWLEQLQAAGNTPPDLDTVLQQPLLQEYFHPGPFCRLARRWEGQADPSLPAAPLLRAIAALVEGPADLVLLHGAHHGRRTLARRRHQRGSLGFSQLLEGLDPGATATAPTPLLQAIGQRYRVALVDEFQDTDPIQWRILRLAFGQGQHQLVMVGDPKQAIYRFRGGDLDTYRRAAEQATACYGLRQNFRSSPQLLAALQRLMAPGLRRSALPVPVVEGCSSRHGPLEPPIELLWCGAASSRTALEQHLVPAIAGYCRQLLRRRLALHHGERVEPLQPGHLCLLVSNHHQAEQLRQALAHEGLASRLVSQADVFASAAATALQRLLDALADPADGNRLRLLAATPLLGWDGAQLGEDDAGRWSALSARVQSLAQELPRLGLLGVIAALVGSRSLARLSQDGRLLADLQQAATLVQERLHRDQLSPDAAASWLRRLRLNPDRLVPETHQVHSDQVDDAIAVVTVHRSKGLEFPVVVCPYLWQAPSAATPSGRPASSLDTGLRWTPPHRSEPHLDLHRQRHWGQGHAAARQHRQAELAERERLAYVAVTRAAHLLVLAWGPVKGQQAAPLVPWLFPELSVAASDPEDDDPFAAGEDEPWRRRLEERVAAGELVLTVVDLPMVDLPDPAAAADERGPGPWSTAPPPPALACGPVPRRSLDRRWGRSSYSSWTRTAHGSALAPSLPPEALEDGRDTLDPALPLPSPATAEGGDGGHAQPDFSPPAALTPAAAMDWPEQGPLATFPRGPAAGDCLHRILENLDGQLACQEPTNRALVEQELRRAGIDQPLELVLDGLEQVRLTPFGGALGPLRVADLPAGRRLQELSFDLSLGWVQAADLVEAFAAHPGGVFGATYAASLGALPINHRGFLTGSIDLVFCAPDSEGQERWWVADWKSNWLGERDPLGRPLACGPRHYHPEAMANLMAHSHYPLQAHLYLVALHRYLGWRLPGYSIERDLGGFAYVFLRGTPGPSGRAALPGAVPGMVVDRPPPGRILALDRALGRPPQADAPDPEADDPPGGAAEAGDPEASAAPATVSDAVNPQRPRATGVGRRQRRPGRADTAGREPE